MPNQPDDLRFSRHHGRRPGGGRSASGTAASPLRAFSRTEAASAQVLVAAARADAVFVSGLQRGDEPSAGQVRQVVAEVTWAFRAADGMIVSSRRRLLAHLCAGDGDAAALEVERHLRGLLYMGRLAQAAESEAVT